MHYGSVPKQMEVMMMDLKTRTLLSIKTIIDLHLLETDTSLIDIEIVSFFVFYFFQNFKTRDVWLSTNSKFSVRYLKKTSGNNFYESSYFPDTHDAEISKLPKILAGELPDRPPPSVPTATPPIPDDSPPCTSRISQDPDDLIHYHHHESNRCEFFFGYYLKKVILKNCIPEALKH